MAHVRRVHPLPPTRSRPRPHHTLAATSESHPIEPIVLNINIPHLAARAHEAVFSVPSPSPSTPTSPLTFLVLRGVGLGLVLGLGGAAQNNEALVTFSLLLIRQQRPDVPARTPSSDGPLPTTSYAQTAGHGRHNRARSQGVGHVTCHQTLQHIPD
ncbi:hypothetical protein B0H12DRAFT_1246225 [Mycena haematopus]|nr:hypothetical protein B0H12DRAFT_1246225 [Mycena haematopus]